MQSRNSSSAFNARWLSYEEVAKTFVPVLHYRQLLHKGHSVLLGPRGCGKTTLLKMLTPRATSNWKHSNRSERFSLKITKPDYTAVYIPSDVRWSYEIANLESTCHINEREANQAQRVMVSLHVVLCILETLGDKSEHDREFDSKLSRAIISQWKLNGTLGSLVDVRASMLGTVAEIRGHLNCPDKSGLSDALKSINASFYGHILDASLWLIQVASMHLGEDDPLAQRWALCFDELEIAPDWLRSELLEALRSSNQKVYLKLTWTPVLPSGLKTSPEASADYRAIRLWHSRVTDPREFCENLTVDFLRERFPGSSITPDEFFSTSLLATEGEEEAPESYDRGSPVYETFKRLASWDDSFRREMIGRGIDPTDPQPKNADEKDQFFRKVKPIVMLRSAHLSRKGGRSRKASHLYAGKEAIYSISEGNPRWLRSLLTDFADRSSYSAGVDQEGIVIAPQVQSQILMNAGKRFKALIQASPFRISDPLASQRSQTLIGLIDSIGSFFEDAIYEGDFPMDPVGSFRIPNDIDKNTLAVLDQLLELGAIVFLGATQEEIPTKLVGERFRLSLLLAPSFKLPLRTYRDISLSNLLTKEVNAKQQLSLEI